MHGLFSCCTCVKQTLTCVSLALDNTKARYLRKGQVYTQGGDGGEGGGAKEQGVGTQVRAELTVSFLVLLGIFFPSVTGMYMYCTCVCA